MDFTSRESEMSSPVSDVESAFMVMGVGALTLLTENDMRGAACTACKLIQLLEWNLYLFTAYISISSSIMWSAIGF